MMMSSCSRTGIGIVEPAVREDVALRAAENLEALDLLLNLRDLVPLAS